MKSRSNFTHKLVRIATIAVGATSLTLALAAEPPVHVRGTVVSATPSQLTVKTSEGTVTLGFDATTRFAGVVPSSLDQIKPGTFVGIANVPGDGASSALEVLVFPDAMKGTGLGDYPWDLAPASGQNGAAQKSAMTNGTVKAATASGGKAAGSAMTNGTVKSTSNSKGLVLSIDYGKGEKKIQVPPNVPVVGVVAADSSKLVAGAHVFVATKADAPKNAAFVAVGIDGTVPPM